MAATAKALALRAELMSDLKIRLSALAQAPAFGSGGEADLVLGAGTAGSDSAFIRINQIASIQKDVLGLSQNVFTPHVAQVVFEANPAGGAGADVGTWATRLQVLGCLIRTGIRVEVYLSANGVAVSAAAITGAPAAWDMHSQYPQSAAV